MADNDKDAVEALGDNFIILDNDGKTADEEQQKFAPRIDDGETEIMESFDSGDEDEIKEKEDKSDDDDNDEDGDDNAGDDGDDEDQHEEGSGDEDEGEDDDASDDDSDEADGDDAGDDTDVDDDADDEPDPKPKKKQTTSERIRQLIKKQREAERRADAAEQRALDLEDQQKKLTPKQDDDKVKKTEDDVDPDAPDPSKFTYGELDPKYIVALSKHETQKVLAEDARKREKEAEDATAEETRKEWNSKYDAKITEGEAAYDDFKEVVLDGADAKTYDLDAATAVMAINSPVGHHVVYYLASNPKLAKRLAAMPVLEQAQEFGRLSARFQKTTSRNTQPNVKPKAPPPPSRRKGSKGVNQFNPETATFEDFEKMGNNALYGKKK